MRRTGSVAIVVVVITVMLTAAVFAEAQHMRRYKPRPGDTGIRQGSGWDQLAPTLVKELELTEKEAAVVMPKIRELMVLKSRTLPGLKRLKALQEDKTLSADAVAAGLKKFRNNLADARAKIIRAEKELVDLEEITPRRELTLTILGILDNGKEAPQVTGAATKKKDVVKQPKVEKEEPETRTE